MRCGQSRFSMDATRHASRITCFTLSFSSRSPTRRARPASPEAPRARRVRARSRPPSTGCAPPQSWRWRSARRCLRTLGTRTCPRARLAKEKGASDLSRAAGTFVHQSQRVSLRSAPFISEKRSPFVTHSRAQRCARPPADPRSPPASPVIASSIALIADRPPFPSLRSARPPHFPFDPHTKNTMAFTSTAARLPGSLVRAEAKPSRTGKSARRLTPRRAIAEPAKAASSKFTPAWKLQVRSRPNRPTSVPKRRASAPTSSADRKVSLLQPIAADASPLSPIFPSAIRPPPP
jgi:hypothetical protein